MEAETRPSKKQRELLTFIGNFIAGHGYGPSYREIMSGMGYRSVATVALHVNNLIAKGHLRKNGRSARSLEVVSQPQKAFKQPKVEPGDERWLVELVEQRFEAVENDPVPSQASVDELYVLTGALKILGLDSAAQAFITRLQEVKKPAV